MASQVHRSFWIAIVGIATGLLLGWVIFSSSSDNSDIDTHETHRQNVSRNIKLETTLTHAATEDSEGPGSNTLSFTFNGDDIEGLCIRQPCL